MKKYLVLFLTSALISNMSLTCAYAYEPVNDRYSVRVGDFSNEGIAQISGKWDTEVEGTTATVAIFAPDKTADDLSSGTNQSSTLVYMGSAKSDAKGEFTFEVTLTGDSGEYSAYFGPAEDGEDLERIPVYFSNKSENKQMLGELNSKAAAVGTDTDGDYVDSDVTSFKDFIDENKDALAFRFSLYDEDKVNHTAVAKLLITHLKKTPFDTDDRAESTGIFRTLVVMQAFKEDKITDINQYVAYLPVFTGENGALSIWYNTADDKVKSELSTRLSKAPFDTIAEFDNKAVEAAVLSTIHYADGEDEVKAVLEEFEDYTDIETSSLTQTVYNGLERNNYADYAALKSAISSLSTSNGNSSTDSGKVKDRGKSPVSIGNNYVPPVQTEPLDSTEGFTDVTEGDWYYDAVYELVDRGIVSGKSQNSFAPADSITREEIVKMLVVTENLTVSETEQIFTDVTPRDWFFGYVNTAANNGIVKGIGDGIFGSGQKVTRQDTAVMLCNILMKKGMAAPASESELEFEDAREISDYARDAVKLLSDLKVINGYDDGCFRPKQYVTRAEAAKLIREFIYIKN